MADLRSRAEPWSRDLGRTWPYAALTAIVLFAVAVFCGAFVAWQNGASSTWGYLIGIVDPAVVALLMFSSCVVAPGAFLGDSFKGVHVLTLPTLFVCGVAAMKLVQGQTPSAVQRFGEVQRFDLIWTNWKFLLVVWAIMCLTFAMLGALRIGQAKEE